MSARHTHPQRTVKRRRDREWKKTREYIAWCHREQQRRRQQSKGDSE